MRLWDHGTRIIADEQVGQPLTGHTSQVHAVAFSPDGDLLATGHSGSFDTGIQSYGFDGTVRLWDLTTGEQVGQPLTGQTGGALSVAFSPDGDLLATGNSQAIGTGFSTGKPDDTVRLWDPTTGEQVGQPLTGHTDAVCSVAFSPDGDLLASGSGDGTVRLWDPTTGEQVGQPLTGHTDGVASVAFSPDGDLLATANNFNGTVRLWDVLDVGRACALAEPYVARSQLDPYVPPGWDATCAYSR